MVLKKEVEMDERTTWCPKHNVHHGLCIDPIKADAPKPKEGELADLLDPPMNQQRFDPYEALDEIRELSPLAGVRRNVERLRAYITGMER